jgi:hypothetical protein
MSGYPGFWPYAGASGGGIVPVAIPEPVTEPVTETVTEPVTPPVTPAVTDPVTQDPPWPDPGQAGNGDPWRLGFDDGDWVDEPAHDRAAAVAGPALAWLMALLRSSELLGGGPGGLLAELASPHPETMRHHLRHVDGHQLRPAGTAASAAFAGGHLMVTGPVKGTGKLLVLAGTILIHAGTRLDWLGDRFARVAAVAGIITVLAFLVAQVIH